MTASPSTGAAGKPGGTGDSPGQYVEIDLNAPIRPIMRTWCCPQRGRWSTRCPSTAAFIDDPAHQWGVLAEVRSTRTSAVALRVTVTPAERPRGPAVTPGPALGHENRVFYPVGRFRTILAGPDIAEARRLGCLKAVQPRAGHQLGAAIRPWAEWSIAAQTTRDPAVRPGGAEAPGPRVAGSGPPAPGQNVIGLSTTYGWSYRTSTSTKPKPAAHHRPGGTKFLSVPTKTVTTLPRHPRWVEAYTRVALSRAWKP